MGIEPIHDGNGNNTKIMKIMPLPSQCERAFKTVLGWTVSKNGSGNHWDDGGTTLDGKWDKKLGNKYIKQTIKFWLR